jgi:hypothetical protein
MPLAAAGFDLTQRRWPPDTDGRAMIVAKSADFFGVTACRAGPARDYACST